MREKKTSLLCVCLDTAAVKGHLYCSASWMLCFISSESCKKKPHHPTDAGIVKEASLYIYNMQFTLKIFHCKLLDYWAKWPYKTRVSLKGWLGPNDKESRLFGCHWQTFLHRLRSKKIITLPRLCLKARDNSIKNFRSYFSGEPACMEFSCCHACVL